ncbi:MAG TPA: DNA polymerase, partial [Terriglobia bacterium]|nr:DNA polymerase [Terriglobia bacterium]
MAQSAAKKLFLFDTMSLVFRAFFAPMQMPLVSPQGMPTQAIFIFVRTLRKLLRDHRPDFVAAAFDLAAPTFRDKLFESYKANRPAFPEDLAAQMPYVRRFCEAMGIKIVEKAGFEADDLIGTLAHQGAQQGYDVFIVSGDEDLFQLVSGKVKVLKPPRSAKERDEDNLFDPKKVEESLGVGPAQVVDWIALTGDPSDNIPGARPLPGQEPALEPGAKKRSYIGPKGATELIQKFGTLENALEHWQQASKQSYRDALRDHRKEALLSKELATIHTAVPLEAAPGQLSLGDPNVEAIVALCHELGFTSLLREFMQEALPPPSVAPEPARQLDTPEALEEWLRETAGSTLGVAPATEGEEGFSARLMSMGLADGERLAEVPLSMTAQRSKLLSAFGRSLNGRKIAAHNAKLLYLMLKSEGIEVVSAAGVAHDTLLYSFLLDPLATSHSLADVLLRAKGIRLPDSPARAASAILGLAQGFAPEIGRKNLKTLYDEIELPLAAVLAEIETAGIRIDPAILGQMSREFEQSLAALTHTIYDLASGPFDVDSPRQLGEILFEKLKLPGGKKLKKSGQYSTVAAVLETLAEQHELPRRILEYRTRAKLKST